MQSANAPDYQPRQPMDGHRILDEARAWYQQTSAPLGADEIDELDKRIPGRLKKRSRLFLQEPL